ncbi:MAG: response regulator [Nitrospiria bacterium]
MASRSKILIIDDEVGPRESLKMILKPLHEVETVDDGVKALEIIQKKEVDFVTLDLKMPRSDGVEVLKKIKELKPETEVLIITGYGSFKSAVDGLRYGACDYLIKPFNISDVINIINKALNRKRKKEKLWNLLDEICHTNGIQEQLEEMRQYY